MNWKYIKTCINKNNILYIFQIRLNGCESMQGWSCGCTAATASAALEAYTEVHGQSYRSYMHLLVCVGVCEKHILQKTDAPLSYSAPKTPKNLVKRRLVLCLYTGLIEGFLGDETLTMKYWAYCFGSDTTTHSLRPDKHAAIDQRDPLMMRYDSYLSCESLLILQLMNYA